ncbi:type II toxin-antitoxin system PemK/MazF family toxin [Halochromatium roseum]|uniref:type II toxin-antitoxin system PemK/MazF family toxin n=1 Tax=Halochromatium roseum TaxID=391920 RepID=UPI001911CE1E|nr:MazF family transcriptional regulator [Halochromatium roseum]
MERPFPLTRGAVHLARLDPAKGAEVGKCRPVVLLTAQYLLDVDPPVFFICPLSSRSDPAFAAIHLAIPARDQLQRESYALVEHCRAISRRRVLSDRIALLSGDEIDAILNRLERMLGR